MKVRALLLLLVPALLFACSSDGAEEQAGEDVARGGGRARSEDPHVETTTTTTTNTSAPVLQPSEIDGRASEYCAGWKAIRTYSTSVEGEAATSEGAYYRGLAERLGDLGGRPPAGVAHALALTMEATNQAATESSSAPLQTPEAMGAQDVLGRYAAEHCQVS